MKAVFKKALSILLSVTLSATVVLQNFRVASANEGDAGGGLISDPVPPAHSESSSGGPPQVSGFDSMPRFGQVTASGSFQYTIPIDLPPGTGGMQPELALVHDSNIRDSIFGYGWTLSGIDVIMRNPTYPIRFNENDRYLFNGQRLIKKPDGTYRTERDLNWIFEFIHPNSSSSYWKVAKPDGTKMYLGYNSSFHQDPAIDGHIDAAGKDGKALLWSKSMEQDARGNAYIIKYVEHGAPRHDYYPSSIVYTVGNGLNAHKTITFEAEDRSDTYTKYVPTKLAVSKRIKRILVEVDGHLSHAYHLTYSYGGQRPVSLLTSLQKFGSDHETALPPYTFTYDTGSDSMTVLTPGEPEFMDPYQYFMRTFDDDGYGHRIISGDFNGDGRMDFIKQAFGGFESYSYKFQLFFATEQTAVDGTFRIVTPAGNAYQNNLRYDPGANIIPGDFNGDGLTDFLRQEHGDWASDDVNTFFVYFATEQTETDGTFDIVMPTNGGWHQRLLKDPWVNLILGDFNADGRTDFLRQTKGDYDDKRYQNFEVFISNGDGTFKIKQPGQEEWGDQYQDALRYDHGARLIPGDFNGDGKTDFIRQEHADWDDDEINTFQVFFATDQTEVDGTFHIVTPSGHQYQNLLKGDGTFLYPGDFNGDGLTDFLRQEHSVWDNVVTSNSDIYISKGTGEFERIPIFPDSHFLDFDGPDNDGGVHLFLTDVDGDGKTDILRQEKNAWALDYQNTFNVITSNFASPRLKQVTTELGASATISYTPLANVEGAVVPGKSGDSVANALGRMVVTSVEYGDGLGESYRYQYQYHDARIKPGKPRDTADLGFRTTREIAPNGSVTEVHYLQDPLYYGLVEKTVSYVAHKDTGNLMKVMEVKHHWDHRSSGAIKQILLAGKTTTTYDLTTGQAADDVEESYQYDLYGNVTAFSSSGRASLAEDGYSVEIGYLYNTADYLVAFPHTVTQTGYTPDGVEQVLGKTRFLYDGQADGAAPVRGNVTEIRKWYGSGWVTMETNAYDAYGNVVLTTDTNGHVTATVFDPVYHDLPVSMTNALGHTESRVFDQLQRPVAAIDRNGLQTHFSYDAFSRIRTQSSPEDGQPLMTTTYDFDLADTGTLKGEYYNNKTLSGTPALVRRDGAIDFGWSHGSPAPGINANQFSVRWTGVIVPRHSEAYTFYLTSDDGSRLYVDGQLVISGWVNQIPTERSATLQLEAGREYTVTVEYYDNTGHAMARLEWSSPSQPRETVPFTALPNRIQTVYNDDDQTTEVTYMDGFGRVIQTKTQAGTNAYRTIDTYYHVDAGTRRVIKRTSVPYMTDSSAFTPRDESQPMATEEAFADGRGGVMQLTNPAGQSAAVIKILKVLSGYNEWWTANKISSELTKPVKRLAYYEAKKVFEHPQIRREIILSGPRRVGKTTIMYQMIDDYLKKGIPAKNILYVSFDHPMLKLCDIGRIIEVFQNNLNPDERDLYLFFDEIQYAQDWDLWLKTLYDLNPGFHIMATGSASPVLVEKAKQSGVGRWTTIRIPTLSFYEYIDLMGGSKPNLSKNIFPTALGSLEKNKLSQLMIALEPLQKHFHRYLLVGGFPEVALSDDVMYAQKIIREDVVDKVLKRDMVSLFPIRNVAELEQIFLYLCMISGNIVVQDTIAKEVGISRPTVAHYMDFLEQANLIYVSQSTEQTGKKVLKAKPKVYLADAAIRNAVLMIGKEVLTDATEMGMMVETAIYKHVHSFNHLNTTQIGYFRDSKTEKEIDIVITYGKMTKLLIEVKYRDNTALSQKEAIVDWANDPKVASAIVITKNSPDFGNTDHKTKCPITKIPAFAFLYLLGHAEYTKYLETLKQN